MKEKPMVSRRTFLESAGVATGAVVATGAFPHPSLGNVKGANERINIGILGPGGRAQEHIRILNHLKDENKGVDIIGLCDVWDGGKWKENGRETGRGLYYSAAKMRPRPPGQGQGPDHQGLSPPARVQGHRCRADRHPRSLARPDVGRRHGGRQGRLLRKADDPHHRRGPQGRGNGQEDQASLHRRCPVHRRPALEAGQPDDHRGQDRPRHAGPDRPTTATATRASGAIIRSPRI